MALVTTPGAANADSYASLAEAVAYVGTLTFAADWPTVEAAQEKLLRQAAVVMETLNYKGYRTGSEAEQALAFPRSCLYDRDGRVIASDVVPLPVKRAQIQLALALASEDRTVDAGGLAPATLTVGSINLGPMQHRIIPRFVLDLLAPYLQSHGVSVPLVRG